MEEASVGILPPFLIDILIFLSIILSIILLAAFSYIWSTQRQDREDIAKLSADIKSLSKRVKELESPSVENPLMIPKEDTLDVKPFGISMEKGKQVPNVPEPAAKPVWDSFLENYNHIAESMAVPGQLKACENFVVDNNLKMLAYAGDMKFIFVNKVEASRFWAWQIEDTEKYVVVPNPMIPYDEELHSQAGMKETFASNYEKGKYSKYFVKLPAILSCTNKNDWKILEPGVIDLRH